MIAPRLIAIPSLPSEKVMEDGPCFPLDAMDRVSSKFRPGAPDDESLHSAPWQRVGCL
jgi:hypothetical protein